MGLGQPRGQGGHMPPDSGPHASESPGPGILLDYRGSLQPPTEGRRCTQPHFHGCPPSPVLLESAIEHRLWSVPRLRASWSLALAQQSTATHPSAGAQAQGASTEMAPGWSHQPKAVPKMGLCPAQRFFSLHARKGQGELVPVTWLKKSPLPSLQRLGPVMWSSWRNIVLLGGPS